MKKPDMKISLQEITPHNSKDAGRCDGTFMIDSRLVVSGDEHGIRFSIIPTTPYQKKYPNDTFDYNDYIENPDRIVYLVFMDNIAAGEIRLRKNWNNYAYIEDIAVDAEFRRRGIGRSLINKAIQWAKEKNLPGVMLETQNNNVAGCMLCQSSGFELAGFERRVYQGIDPNTDEIALYGI